MIQVIIAGLLAFGIIKLIEKAQKRDDQVSAGAIVAATVFLSFLGSLVIVALELPEWYGIFLLPVYFMVPFLILWRMWELRLGRSSAYAGIISGSILFVEIALYFVVSW